MNNYPTSFIATSLTDDLAIKILNTVTERLNDSAIAVRKHALNAYADCAGNKQIVGMMKEETAVGVITNLLQDSSGMMMIVNNDDC